MEVNAAGYYVVPRYMDWEKFLIHTRDVLACRNKMLVQFSMKEGPVQVTDFQKKEWPRSRQRMVIQYLWDWVYS